MDTGDAGRGQIIKVLLVDDSRVALTVLKRILSRATDIRVVGEAENGKDALLLIPRLDPDVICTDLHMPVMDGLEFTREVMDKFPRPILVVSVSVKEGSQNVFKLLEAGAVDVFQKPRSGLEEDYARLSDEFMSRIRILSGVRVFRRARKAAEPVMRTEAAPGEMKMVAIGASTGGPQALYAILSSLPKDFPVPVVCVQHISNGFLTGLVEWLDSVCPMKVKVAGDGERPVGGTVYFPREGTHLVIGGDGAFKYSNEPPLNGHRPSITMALKSVARAYGRAAIGVVLTGMGDDGAEGMRAIAEGGGVTIAQDEKTSVVWSMPRNAIELKAAGEVVPLEDIPAVLIKKAFVRNRT